MYWIIAIVLIVIIGFFLDREIYFYEGVHLGPRFQAWFYDRWATRYDAGKRDSQLHDDEMLAGPLLERLKTIPEPFVLDFATGTGRLSYALLNRPEFRGHIIALDISQKMLEEAAEKIAGRAGGVRSAVARPLDEDASTSDRAGAVPPLSAEGARVEFLRHQSMPLPFPDAAFDAVCCLEVLELLPDAQAALNEMSRLLRPGGTLLTSRGTEDSGRKAKVKSAAEFTSMLEKSGFENIQITGWWKLFDRVLATKRGISNPVRVKSLADVLRCSSCGNLHWTKTSNIWKCQNCSREMAVSKEGIILN
jgi:SAM-dependent methyltransferase